MGCYPVHLLSRVSRTAAQRHTVTYHDLFALLVSCMYRLPCYGRHRSVLHRVSKLAAAIDRLFRNRLVDRRLLSMAYRRVGAAFGNLSRAVTGAIVDIGRSEGVGIKRDLGFAVGVLYRWRSVGLGRMDGEKTRRTATNPIRAAQPGRSADA